MQEVSFKRIAGVTELFSNIFLLTSLSAAVADISITSTSSDSVKDCILLR